LRWKGKEDHAPKKRREVKVTGIREDQLGGGCVVVVRRLERGRGKEKLGVGKFSVKKGDDNPQKRISSQWRRVARQSKNTRNE